MVQTIQAQDITLEQLQENFGLQLTTDRQFFPEWQENLPSLSDEEKRSLERVRSNYFNLVNRRPLLEEGVKMVILSPLLDLAGFFQPPFSIRTETSVEISAEDNDLIVRGRIDILVVQNRLWILVIESKSTKFDVMEALPQALAYMLKDSQNNKPQFGFLINGREFVFVKLQKANVPIYGRSYALSIDRENELEQVLAVLKHIGNFSY
ncbi:MAG: type I restriction endonuclease subunit R [Okeania sp. SIO2F4]|uniref:type I restriction enzyme HsdR N-terminal domain-containing protein n=1 Tax=Okeania sp. SIO2F4 TaxID=2607790 RepID=UPI00142CDC4C|nr:type I restriction enzyme HsdR N-terminal domain-containing protein [Okeania sp. SIO2F4]MDJ0519465.1 type I restriction enzyme HsdR N-terminal domain-containing protein [Trichodesmium sp. MO_231.B1]NES07263.1 type I restriction endonuclease subunit R [Okeania sp. SIO2F4]